MQANVPCPRCQQDYLLRVEILALLRQVILCPECDALWLSPDDVAAPQCDDYGRTWFDYETYMSELGLLMGRLADEIRVLGPLTQSGK